ncbi:hypothetical protein [Erythrobacter sp. CCH5-A1]|jgi:hypothetical protein|uniref:hypothetical protein n=1 Tax=Erythrobacter sp. CCH5-A1 TaxID=1768792 RepID=UPI000833021C|nr:hypothetical protein [Erythrobacter sp. CCH5-A1]
MAGLRAHLLAGLALALAPAATLMAQDPAPETPSAEPTENEIIVEGYTEKEVRNFLWRSVIPTGRVIAKRTGPVCVGIDNVPAVLSEPLKARIEHNLDTLGIERATPGCKVNAVIVFDRDAHGFVNALSRYEGGAAFDALYLPERRRLIEPVRPAYNWHYMNLEQLQQFLGTPQPLTRQGASLGRGFQGVGFDNSAESRLALYATPAEISKTFSVVDIDTIDGITIEQLGDYLTMQMLVEFRPDVKGWVPADSILNLFTPSGANPDAPPEMSTLDRIIVREMYRTRGNYGNGAIRNSIARASVRELEQTGALLAQR